MNQYRWKLSCFNFLAFMFALSLILMGIASYFFSKSMIKQKIHQNIIIERNSEAYKIWTDPPAKVYRKYYLFDVKNPQGIEKGEKPELVQRGPYVYSEKWEKRHINFLNPNIVQFTPVYILKFEPFLSAGLETDNITFLNIPAVGMIEQILRNKFENIESEFINFLCTLMDIKLFVTKTVGELISGYQDPLLKLAKVFEPSIVKSDEFSLLNDENGTEWVNYTIMTGYDSMEDYGKIISWNGQEKLNFWNSDYDNLINGSDGTLFAPFLTKDRKIYAFNPDMCRSYYLTYSKENNIEGVDTYDFHLSPDIFNYENSENKQFCGDTCLGNGVLNISSCRQGVSGFISQPHFLNADPKFITDVIGLSPNDSIHDYVLHFEKITTVPLKGNIRLQVNFFIPQDNKINLIKNVKPVLLPVIWFDEDLALDSEIVSQFKEISLYVNLAKWIPISISCFGGVLTIFFIFKIIKQLEKKTNEEENIPKSEECLINESSSLINKEKRKIYSDF